MKKVLELWWVKVVDFCLVKDQNQLFLKEIRSVHLTTWICELDFQNLFLFHLQTTVFFPQVLIHTFLLHCHENSGYSVDVRNVYFLMLFYNFLQKNLM